MLLDILRQLNWIDFIVIILLFRICYAGAKAGFPVELFKLGGVILAIYLSLHYYTHLSDWVRERLPVADDKAPLEFLDFVAALILAVLGYLSFVLLRIAFCRFITIEAVPRLNKWGGFVIGAIRGVFLTGLVIFLLFISTITYLKDSVSRSYTGGYFLKVAPHAYGWMWDSFMSKFAPKENFNATVSEVTGETFKK